MRNAVSSTSRKLKLLPTKYDDIRVVSKAWYFENGLACAQIGDKWGIIDTTGKEHTPIKYDEIVTRREDKI